MGYSPAAVKTLMRYALEDALSKSTELLMDFGAESKEYLDNLKEIATIKGDMRKHQQDNPELYR